MSKKSKTENKLNFPKEIRERIQEQKLIPYKEGDLYPIGFKKLKLYFKRKLKKKYLFLVDMKLRNSMNIEFTVSTTTNAFEYSGGLYIIDQDRATKDITTGLDKYYFHQDFSLPFQIEYDIDSISNTLGDDDNIVKALNPRTLKDYKNSSIIEKVLSSDIIESTVKFIKMMVVVIAILTVIQLILILKSSGVL